MNKLKSKLLAEYDACFGAVMISWPHEGTDWAPMLVEARKCYMELARAILQAGCTLVVITPDASATRAELRPLPSRNIVVVEVPTNDTWVRDYGMLTLRLEDTPIAADFQFNGWGLKFAANLDNCVTTRLFDRLPNIVKADFRATVLEGGSVETDGNGTILTTSECLLSANRNNFHSKAEAEAMLSRCLGAERVLWLDNGALQGDDTDSHVDTLARFASDDTIVYVKCYRDDDTHYLGLHLMEEELREFRTTSGQPYNLVGLPLPDPCYDPEDGHRLPATYANFLITPRAVIMPTYGQERNDRMARMMLESVFAPEREVISVDCRALIRQHGSLHCATMQVPRAFVPLA